MKVMIAVTHLLGTGHLARALTLARAFLAAGHSAEVISGGMPAPQLDRGDMPLLQLPPLRSDGVDFARLLDDSGQIASDRYLAARRSALCDAVARSGPDVLITELFPFGRRNLKVEFAALLETAKALPAPPLIAASIRDILAPPSKPAKAAYADEMIARYYDAVLVHADEQITPLEVSWPVSDILARRLRYTGFVSPAPMAPTAETPGKDEIIVSVGGGNVGDEVLTTALLASRNSAYRWRILVGGRPERVTEYQKQASQNALVEAARPDFRAMLHQARASVSMCGYNTALDVLQAGCPAVFVPFDAGTEVEQGLRAAAMAQQAGITVLPSGELTPETLNAKVAEVIAAPRRDKVTHGLRGAARTVEIVSGLLEARR